MILKQNLIFSFPMLLRHLYLRVAHIFLSTISQIRSVKCIQKLDWNCILVDKIYSQIFILFTCCSRFIDVYWTFFNLFAFRWICSTFRIYSLQFFYMFNRKCETMSNIRCFMDFHSLEYNYVFAIDSRPGSFLSLLIISLPVFFEIFYFWSVSLVLFR